MGNGSEFFYPRRNVPLKEVRVSHGVSGACKNCGELALTAVELPRHHFSLESRNGHSCFARKRLCARDQFVRNAPPRSTFGCDGAALGKPVFLKLHREGYGAAEIGDVVIENALIRLACCQRTYSADSKIFIHAIVRGKRKNFADVIATSLVILPHHQGTNCVDKKGTSQSRRITEINCIIASLRGNRIDVWRLMGFGGCGANICVRTQRDRLSATKAKRNLRVYDEGMVLKEGFKAVFLGEPVVIGTQPAKADCATAARDI